MAGKGTDNNTIRIIHLQIYLSSRPPKNLRGWISFFLTKLPILQWMWSYKLEYLPVDVIGGITVAIIAVPVGKIS